MQIKNFEEVHHLYKYRYFDCNHYHIKTILDNEFYFPTREELNDPFDLSLRPRYELGTKEQMIEHYLNEIEQMDIPESSKPFYRKSALSKITSNPDFVKKSLIDGYNTQIRNYRVCSFSANTWNDILMWSHYCWSNTGFCVGINWQKLSQYLWDKYREVITPWVVKYGKNYPFINPFMENESEESYRNVFSFKFDIWSYENEVRLIMKSSKEKVFIIPDEFIDEIILGLNIMEKNQNIIVSALKLKKIKPKLYRIIQKDFSFEFDRYEIEY